MPSYLDTLRNKYAKAIEHGLDPIVRSPAGPSLVRIPYERIDEVTNQFTQKYVVWANECAERGWGDLRLGELKEKYQIIFKENGQC